MTPGRRTVFLALAHAVLFCSIARILAVFTVSKACDADGKEVEPVLEWTSGVTRYVIPSKMRELQS